jgi:hypothetical protein
MLRNLLRKAGILPPAPPSDQTYYEASVDNALIERDKIIDRVVGIAESGKDSNETLRAGIARMRSSSSRDLMADLVHGMKSRGGAR